MRLRRSAGLSKSDKAAAVVSIALSLASIAVVAWLASLREAMPQLSDAAQTREADHIVECTKLLPLDPENANPEEARVALELEVACSKSLLFFAPKP
jgi:hypothetical protein